MHTQAWPSVRPSVRSARTHISSEGSCTPSKQASKQASYPHGYQLLARVVVQLELQCGRPGRSTLRAAIAIAIAIST